MESSESGVIIRVHARKCRVVSDVDGREISCFMSGKLFEHLKGETKPVAVGDRVRFKTTPDGAALEALFPRHNALTRPAAGKRGRVQTIAANIDRMIVVAAVKSPPLRTGLIDRFLVAAGVEGFKAIVCLNKIDLLATQEEKAGFLDEPRALYTDLGYDVIATSALTGSHVDRLEAYLSQGISLVVGHSGVGKSTLINRVNPDLKLKTGMVSDKKGKGKHTTTAVSLLRICTSGFVVDTPGIREFGIHSLEPNDLGHYFPEMARKLPDCQFPNCTHRHEPNCAVIKAVESNEITNLRYKSYLKILEELNQ